MAQDLALDEGLNSALLAALFYLDGQAEVSVFASWLPQIESFVLATWQRCISTGVSTSERGMHALEEGLKEWKKLSKSAIPGETEVREAVSWLGWGAKTMESILICHDTRASDVPCRIPFDMTEDLIEKSLDALHQSWYQEVDTLVLTWEDREQLEQEMNTVLEDLGEALVSQDRKSAEIHSLEIESLWDQAHRLAHERAMLGQYEQALIEAARGALCETVPDIVLESFLDYLTDSSGRKLAGTEYIREFLAGREISSLHLAIDQLLATAKESRRDVAFNLALAVA